MLGCQTFGWGADEASAHTLADCFVDSGGTFFDTSNIYNEGESERILGTWIKSRGNRHRYVIASKVFFPAGDKGPNDTGLTRKHILDQIDRSLKRLQTDFIDLYQTHCASNWTGAQLVRANMLAEKNHRARIDCLQPEYSLLIRSTEWELLPVCREEGIGVIAWSPLAGGWLSGKYRRDAAPPPDSRVGRADRWDDLPEQRESELTWRIIDALWEVATARGKSCAQVALNWVRQHPDVTAPIIGARKLDQLKDNLASTEWELTPEETEKLNAASAVPLPSPYNFIARYSRKRS
jgi:aryl-alcohol dehydrogenase-like predicted oxidoreductase